MAAHPTIRLFLAAVAATVLASSLAPGPASAAVITLRPGESDVVAAGTTTPALPPKLDVVLLMDTTGSMGGEISNVQTGATSTFDTIRADSPDSNFAVAAFDDYPHSTYGSPTIMVPANAPDRPYYLLKDLTSVKAEWQTAVNALDTNNGLDIPESQVPALYAAATGASLTWPGGSTPGGAGISFRSNAAHVIVLVSDAAFHNDKAGNDAYSFTAPTYAEALTALADDHARVIAIDSGTAGDPPTGTGSFPDMTAIATDTGATRSLIPGTGAGLSPAMLAALDALTYDVTSVVSCDPLQVGLNPASFTAVAHESPVAQDATITVPADVSAAELPTEAPLDCTVSYIWGDVAIGSVVEQVQVVLPTSIEVEGRTTQRRVKASGTLTPGHDTPGITVTFARKKKLGGYRDFAEGEATLKPEGRFSARFPRPNPGRCRVTASFPGDAGHDPSEASDKFPC